MTCRVYIITKYPFYFSCIACKPLIDLVKMPGIEVKEMKPIRFIHAADLHIDSPFRGLRNIPDKVFTEVYDSTFLAVTHIVDEAIAREVDFILLVGDVFDEASQSIRGQIHLREQFSRLNQSEIPVYLSYGNHDYLQGAKNRIDYPENVHVFNSEDVTCFSYEKDGETLAHIHGFSYQHRALYERKINEFPTTNTVRDVYEIGMLHGSLASSTEHEPYAPFQLKDLLDKPFDYWALGHIHTRTILSKSPGIAYSGNTQARHINEQGAKGCYEVTLTKNNAQFEFIQTSSIEFVRYEINLIEETTIYDLENDIQQMYESYINQGKLLVRLEIETTEINHNTWVENGDLDEMIEVLNEQMLTEQNWIYIFSYELKVIESDLQTLPAHDPFMRDLLKQVDSGDVNEALQAGLTHRELRKYVSPLGEKDVIEVKEKAKNFLQNRL